MRHHRAAVKAHDLLDYRQAKADSMLALSGAIRLPKAIEYRSQRGGFDALSRIGHDDFDVRIYPLHADLNFAAVRSELDGIGDQVPDHLLKPPRIAGDSVDARIDDLLQRDGFGLSRDPHAFDSRPDHFGKIDRLHIEAHPSAFDPGDVEQVFDQLRLSSDRPFDGRHSAARIFAKCRITK